MTVGCQSNNSKTRPQDTWRRIARRPCGQQFLPTRLHTTNTIRFARSCLKPRVPHLPRNSNRCPARSFSPPRNVSFFLILFFSDTLFVPVSVGAAEGGGALRGTLNPKSTMARWGHKLGHAVGAGGGRGGKEEPAGGGGVGDGEHEQPPALGAMTIDRVVEQLFFVRVSVYNANGKLSEPQQVPS